MPSLPEDPRVDGAAWAELAVTAPAAAPPATPELPAVMTVAEVAAFLRLHPWTIRAMWKAGELEGNKRGHTIRLFTPSVVAWARGQGRVPRSE